MNIETVNELIASLESAGELSIREQKFLKLAKAYQQLAAENVALKGALNKIAFTYPLSAHIRGMTTIQTPTTDRIVAGIKADGAEACVRALVTADEADDFVDAPNICAEVARLLREGADK